MTNTLHRAGAPEDLQDDYILFAMCTKGKNDAHAVQRLRQFLTICARHQPINMGDGRHGGVHRPSRRLNPLVHWRRNDQGTLEAVIDGVSEPTTAAVVFDNPESLQQCLREVKSADLGLSINIAALTEAAHRCSRAVDITRHAVEYSFGFIGDTTLLPDRDTLALTTMCGHGMIASSFAQKMIEWVKTGRRTPSDCARYMSRFCVCGVFNPTRAERLLCRMAGRHKQQERDRNARNG